MKNYSFLIFTCVWFRVLQQERTSGAPPWLIALSRNLLTPYRHFLPQQSKPPSVNFLGSVEKELCPFRFLAFGPPFSKPVNAMKENKID